MIEYEWIQTHAICKRKMIENRAHFNRIEKGEKNGKKLLNRPNRSNKLNWSTIVDTTLDVSVTNKTSALKLNDVNLLSLFSAHDTHNTKYIYSSF